MLTRLSLLDKVNAEFYQQQQVIHDFNKPDRPLALLDLLF